mgnify:FL=1
MKKKLLTALLVGAMALNITACGGSSDAAAPADNDQQTTTTDTAADDAADTEEDAVDVEDAAEAADTTEEEGFSLLDVTADLVDAALYAVDDDNTEYVLTLFRDPDGYSYVSLMIVPQDGQDRLPVSRSFPFPQSRSNKLSLPKKLVNGSLKKSC